MKVRYKIIWLKNDYSDCTTGFIQASNKNIKTKIKQP